ncbi:MAG: hypothetical protein HY554_00390 [Elusimicrobia bacterium]|nr:hypothetical protein [Elusimicrobiota bacterium]
MPIDEYIEHRLRRFLAVTLLMLAASLLGLGQIANALKAKGRAQRAPAPAAGPAS